MSPRYRLTRLLDGGLLRDLALLALVISIVLHHSYGLSWQAAALFAPLLMGAGGVLLWIGLWAVLIPLRLLDRSDARLARWRRSPY